MKDNEKYAEVLKALGELLHEKNDEIYFLKYDVEMLKKKLEAAEEKIAGFETRKEECHE